MAASEDFLDLATGPLADNPELQLHARYFLQQHLVPDTPDEVWESAATTLERRDSKWFSQYWRRVLWVAVCMIALTCIGFAIPELLKAKSLLNDDREVGFYLNGMGPTPNELPSLKALRKGLSPDQKLILLGNPDAGKYSDQLKPLCDRFPDSPTYYADYAAAYMHDHGATLPPDFIKTAARIDPDNGWFPALAAASTSRNVAKAKRRSITGKSAHDPREWDVMDLARLDDSIKLFHEATRLPCFESYRNDRIKEQLALLAPAQDVPDYFRNRMFACSRPDYAGWLYYLPDAIAAKAWLLANEGNREQFQSLLADWKLHVLHFAHSASTGEDYSYTQMLVTRTAPTLRESAERLGLDTDVAVLTETMHQFDIPHGLRIEPSDSTQATAQDEMIEDHGGGILDTPGNIANPSELTPGRMIDQTVGMRVFAFLIAALAGLMSGVCALYRFRNDIRIRRLSLRLTALLTVADWLWMAASVTLPLLYHQAIYQLTPLGGRDWSYQHESGAAHLGEAILWASLTLMAPIITARWRLRKRLPGLKLMLPKSAAGTVMLALLASAIPLAGLLFVLPPGSKYFPNLKRFVPDEMVFTPRADWIVLAGCFLLIALMWWILHGITALLGSQSLALGRQLVARLLVPTYLFSLIPLFLLLPIYQAQEHDWIQRVDQKGLMFEAAGFNRYGSESIRQPKAELLEMLAPLESNPLQVK